jgi:deferrochelatase/peroxidase EfeB
VPFHGQHQAGIATPAQAYLHLTAFDVTADSKARLRDLLVRWTAAARALTAGRMYDAGAGASHAAAADPGEAGGLPPSQLTLTVGFGPGLFAADRFGLARRRPPALRALPPFPGEKLDAAHSYGDMCVQACANDPQVAFHAIHVLFQLAGSDVTMRWAQLGFGRAAGARTGRNLLGFKDGTNNIRAEDHAAMGQHVWLGASDSPGWMRGGTYLVARRIRMLIEVWDRASLQDQEQTIGRVKDTGAPLGGRKESDPVDRARLPVDAHIKLAGPASNGGERILRRGYSFTDGMDPDLGELDAGLFFICFQRDPHKQFVAIQRRLASNDALNEYIKHTGSAVFAVPPGVRPGGFVADGLFRSFG